MKRALFTILGGVVLSAGWGVSPSDIGFIRFVAVWVVGSVILTELMPYMTKK